MFRMEVSKTTTTSKNINYRKLKNEAYSFLNRYTNGKLPIDLLGIITHLDNLHLMKYTKLAKENNMDLKQVCQLLNSEDGALWYKSDSQTYILLYNDTIDNKERIRFTIAHELGHYALRHNETTDKTILSRYNLSESEYKTFETEANFFAKHLLVPFPVLGNYKNFFHSMDHHFIQTVFQVSYSTAKYVIGNLDSMQSAGLGKDAHEVEKKFAKYIETSQKTRICQTCQSKIKRDSKYCHICDTLQPKGETSLKAYLRNREKEKERMKYSKYDLDSDGYPIVCPKCENEELDGSAYCNVCGIYTRNICLGDYEHNYDVRGYAIPIVHYLDNGCKTVLSGNSRYCPDCGGKSSYFYQGLLKNWDLEKEEL